MGYEKILTEDGFILTTEDGKEITTEVPVVEAVAVEGTATTWKLTTRPGRQKGTKHRFLQVRSKR